MLLARNGKDASEQVCKPLHIDALKEVLEATIKIGSPDQPSSPSRSDLPVCDERQLNELLEVNEPDKFVTDVLQLFIEQAAQLASRLPGLADDPKILAAEAHKLKGTAGYVGAMRAAYFCGIAENAPHSSPSQLGQTAVAEFKESLTLSIDDYRKRLNGK